MIDLLRSDLGMKSFCKNVATAGYSICYRYYSPESDDYFDIHISNAELESIQ